VREEERTIADHLHVTEAVADLRLLVGEAAVVAVVVQEAIRDQDHHQNVEDHTVAEDVAPPPLMEEVIGVVLEVIVDLAVVHPHHVEDGPTEIEGIEVIETTMIEEGLHQDTMDVALLLDTLDVVFLLMIIVVGEEATMIEAVETIMDRPEEEATEDMVMMVLLVMIRIMTGHQLQGMVMDPHVEGMDHLHLSVVAVVEEAVIAAVVPSVVVAEEVVIAVDVKKEKEFQESHCWFETSVLLLPIKILVWRLDVLAMFVMFTSQEITIHSNRKASHLSSMPMPTRPARHVMR